MKYAFPPQVLSQHIAVLGKTGSGKSSTCKLIIEQVVAEGARVCVLDPIKSDWWGVTSSSNGKHPGLPFHILGGPKGHVPLHAQAGNAIGEIVGSGQLPLSILDMANFEMGGLQQFFVQFVPALMRKMRGVLYLVVEEAHEFAPKERAGFGQENLAIHFAKKLATAGRSKGIRLIVATQRTQALHNALLGSCDTMIAHRLVAPADKEPVVKWLQSNLTKERAKEVEASLSQLKTGEAWICSGEAALFERRHFPRITTYDNTATPDTESGDVHVETAKVDLEKLTAIIGHAVDEAKANDPAELKRKIVKLEREANDLRTARGLQQIGSPPVNPVIKEVLVPDKEQLSALRIRLRDLESLITAIQLPLESQTESLKQLRADITTAAGVVAGALADQRQSVYTAVIKPHVRTIMMKSRPDVSFNNGELTFATGGLRRMMIALAQRGNLNRRQLGLRAGLSSTSGTFGTYLGKLRSSQWVEEHSGFFSLTLGGLAALGQYDPLPEGQELLNYWLGELGDSGAARMLRALAAAYPKPMTREALGEAAAISHSSGTFGTYLGKLRTLELVDGRGELKASDELFS